MRFVRLLAVAMTLVAVALAAPSAAAAAPSAVAADTGVHWSGGKAPKALTFQPSRPAAPRSVVLTGHVTAVDEHGVTLTVRSSPVTLHVTEATAFVVNGARATAADLRVGQWARIRATAVRILSRCAVDGKCPSGHHLIAVRVAAYDPVAITLS